MELSSVQSTLGTEVLRTTSELVAFGLIVQRLYVSYFVLVKLFEKYEIKECATLGVLEHDIFQIIYINSAYVLRR